MSSDEKCCWPHCQNERDCMYLDKPLCDKHCDLVQSEDREVGNRARKKIGLPPFSLPPPWVGVEERLGAGYYGLDEEEE